MRHPVCVVVRTWDTLVNINAGLACALLPFIMVSVTADVIARYFLGQPIGWVIEFAEYGLLAVTFLGMAWLVRFRDGHVRVDLLLQNLPDKPRRYLETLTSLAAGITCAAGAWFALLTTVSQFKRGVLTIGIYPVEKYLLIGLIAYGLATTAVELMRRTLRAWQGKLDDQPAPVGETELI